MTYEERVRAIAEEMAKVACGKLGSWNDDNIRNSIVESYLPFARIAVKHMAEAVKEACWDVAWHELVPQMIERGFYADDSEEVKEWKEYLDSKGLNPDHGQEAGRHGKKVDDKRR